MTERAERRRAVGSSVKDLDEVVAAVGVRLEMQEQEVQLDSEASRDHHVPRAVAIVGVVTRKTRTLDFSVWCRQQTSADYKQLIIITQACLCRATRICGFTDSDRRSSSGFENLRAPDLRAIGTRGRRRAASC